MTGMGMDWFDEQRQGGVGDPYPHCCSHAHLTIGRDVPEEPFHHLLDERVMVTHWGTM